MSFQDRFGFLETAISCFHDSVMPVFAQCHCKSLSTGQKEEVGLCFIFCLKLFLWDADGKTPFHIGLYFTFQNLVRKPFNSFFFSPGKNQNYIRRAPAVMGHQSSSRLRPELAQMFDFASVI